MQLSPEQNIQLLKEIIATVYTDGVDDISEYYHDPDRSLLWGTFFDREKNNYFDFEIDLTDGVITY
jgi:hypothetical protein